MKDRLDIFAAYSVDYCRNVFCEWENVITDVVSIRQRKRDLTVGTRCPECEDVTYKSYSWKLFKDWEHRYERGDH